MTILFNDERFFKMKPTLVYFLFGSILLAGLFRGKSYLQSLMGTMLPMDQEGWIIISRRITGFFFFLALLNEFVWRTFSTEVWVYFKTFGLSVALLIFLASQYPVLLKYGNFDNDGKN
jgi:intracellular septation protein